MSVSVLPVMVALPFADVGSTLWKPPISSPAEAICMLLPPNEVSFTCHLC